MSTAFWKPGQQSQVFRPSNPTLRGLPMMENWEDSADQQPSGDALHTRITNPGVKPDGNLAEILEGLTEAEKEDIPMISDEQREYFQKIGTLAEFYDKVLEPWRRRQVATGLVAPATLVNERQTIRCFSAYDLQARPPQLDPYVPWNGRPLGYIRAAYVTAWIKHRLQFGSARGKLFGRSYT